MVDPSEARCADCGGPLIAPRWRMPGDRCGSERLRARIQGWPPCPELIFEPPRTRAGRLLGLALCFLSAALVVALVWWALEVP